MGNIETVFLTGGILFLVGAGLLVVAYLYYIGRGQALIDKYAACDCTRWTATRWMYPTFILSLFLAGILYLSMYLQQGYSSRDTAPSLTMMWERWLILALVGFLFSRCLTYIMTINSDDEQSFTLVFLYTLAYLTLFPATISQLFETRLLWTIVSIVSFLTALLFYVFPNNKFACLYHTPSRMQYHKPFICFILFYYVYNIIIYFISNSNEYTSNGLNFLAEATAYLVGDVLFLLGFALIILVCTFVNLKDTLRLVNKETQKISFASGNVVSDLWKK